MDPVEAERLTARANLNAQQRDNLPSYPHRDEPQETPAEHAIERTMGHEVRPGVRGDPYGRFGRVMDKRLPPHAMTTHIPDVTGAGRMMNRPLPRQMSQAPVAPMRFDPPRVTAPQERGLDPFKGLTGNKPRKKRALPKGMQMFSGKGKGLF